ncbi:hypothetical protein CAOG_009574 [Capsaspora owczarzaki ATCC 30864]|uniref:Uncharacterized protein n=1 Tax=Capsaspora owczarzaki (strain ATCC 30864) TaxID=595528 RepID=A0A0D2U9A0_CAPO3|nr:hypothetical protein CAOG_009574 [Capsaspora owczarzaki ATCC 30864]
MPGRAAVHGHESIALASEAGSGAGTQLASAGQPWVYHSLIPDSIGPRTPTGGALSGEGRSPDHAGRSRFCSDATDLVSTP